MNKKRTNEVLKLNPDLKPMKEVYFFPDEYRNLKIPEGWAVRERLRTQGGVYVSVESLDNFVYIFCKK